jgi:hypothetical protein
MFSSVVSKYDEMMIVGGGTVVLATQQTELFFMSRHLVVTKDNEMHVTIYQPEKLVPTGSFVGAKKAYMRHSSM